MKVKENMWGKRGRPRKFHAGETIEWRLRAPDNLLMELRICGRLSRKSINDEIIARLLISLNYQPERAVIRTAKGERLIALAAKFEHWLDDLIKTDNEPAESEDNASAHEEVWMWREGERVLIPGKTSGYSMRIPENLADEIRIMARIHKRSLNDEMLTRLMNSLGYFSERLLEQNDDAQALKVLCMAFEWYLKEKIAEAEDRGASEEKQE
ncbi:Arc family DNA-binding protein [Enterobacter sp.]|uniref:Arc family DNA-binding protein n=1 Tax=Enterobacter sp. TaxID=42895 RepID=UPI00296E8482|nr:Arc family DNA-binding protein [Enterobacter sp.]